MLAPTLTVSVLTAVLTATPALVPVAVTDGAGLAASSRPAARFAADITAHARAGWRVRDAFVDDTGGDVVLALTLSDGHAARRFMLGFSAEGDVVRGYRSEPMAVPDHQRTYRWEPALLELLAAGAPGGLWPACDAYFVEGADAGVVLDPFDYYEVRARVLGARAAEAAADALTGHLDDGYALTAIRRDERAVTPGSVATVVFELQGDDRIGVAVGTDAVGRVVALEHRAGPAVGAWHAYIRAEALIAALQRGGGLSAVLLPESQPSFDEATLVMPDGQRFAIGPRDFEVGDEGCGC